MFHYFFYGYRNALVSTMMWWG